CHRLLNLWHGARPKVELMKKFVFIFAVACISFPAWGAQKADITRWEHEAQNVTIIRDNWGIAHVYGKTDADAVFGMNTRRPKTISIAWRRITSTQWDAWRRRKGG